MGLRGDLWPGAGFADPVAEMMSDIDYEDLDPGIRDTVRILRQYGFQTTDSGDGAAKFKPESKYYGCTPEPYAHVYCVSTPGRMVDQARRLAEILGSEWTVEGVFMATSGTAFLSAIKMSQAQMASEFYAAEVAK